MARPTIESRDPKCVGTTGAARLLQLSEGHVRKLADWGELPHTRDAKGARVFKVALLEQYALRRAYRTCSAAMRRKRVR